MKKSVLQRIQTFNANRDSQLVQLKYKFLAENVFRFYRGTCHLFVEDLAKNISWSDATCCWICGDLHIENFGSYKGDNGIVYFDTNDFDESILAPATYDIARMLTSIYLAASAYNFTEATADNLCRIFVNKYADVLKTGKPLIIERQVATGLLQQFLIQVATRPEQDFFDDRIEFKNKKPQVIIKKKKTIAIESAKKEMLLKNINDWFAANAVQYSAADAAYRIAGTGGVGMQRFIVPSYDKQLHKLHLFDIKESPSSSLQPYIKIPQPKWNTEAERIAAIQKRVQHVTPALLLPMTIDKKSFVLKELQPSEDRMDLTLCEGKESKLVHILETMAQVTASGHLRSGGRQGSSIADELIEFGAKHETWSNAVMAYAKKYSLQVQSDYEEYCKSFLNDKN